MAEKWGGRRFAGQLRGLFPVLRDAGGVDLGMK